MVKQYLNLTDGELWRAIAENTVALLVQKQLELDSYVGAKDRVHRGTPNSLLKNLARAKG
jgi:hypothetical protein